MIRRSLVIGAAALALLGGGAAVAYASGPTSDTPSAPASAASPDASASASTPAHPRAATLRTALQRSVHATWVSRDAKGGFITHDAIRGQVTSVSGTSISVRAGDGLGETFSVTSATKVRVITLSPRSTTTGSIGSVAVGDRVLVTGVGTGTPAAQLVRVVTR